MATVTIEQAFQTALAHHQAGRLVEAEAIYRQILAVEPRHANALQLLGLIAHHMGRVDVAVDLITKAIAIIPNCPEAHYNLGNALIAKGQLDEAAASYRQAIALRPNYAEAHNNLGNALKDKSQTEEAVTAFRQAIALNPNLPEAYNNLGNLLKDKGQLDEAVVAYRQTIALKPNLPEAHYNLGVALYGTGQLDEAAASYRKAVALRPNYAEAHNNLGNALKDKSQTEEAVTAYREAISLIPNYAEAHSNLALALLLQGNFTEGWAEHEWRWKLKVVACLRRNLNQPQWDGSHLAGRTILLHAEQGFGDAIQFIRYVPLVQERGGKAIIECQPELQALLQANMPDLPVVARGHTLPAFDVHCPLLSLPRIFATDLSNIPRNVPYLHASVADAGIWRDRIAGYSSEIKAGIVWAGNPNHTNDRNRSLNLSSLTPLSEVPGVRFFSLQKGKADSEAKMVSAGIELTDMAGELKDFADTAALIANLDLVITVDTAVAHLAGAMGKPVWTLLPFAPDWRWLLVREDSPWYPTMRLFRQPTIGDWDSVIRRVAGELAVFLK